MSPDGPVAVERTLGLSRWEYVSGQEGEDALNALLVVTTVLFGDVGDIATFQLAETPRSCSE